ncbi:hypothetical protein [Paraburkholderia sp. JHI869]|uniref:hypothetical protein n=1 Tax=Paraburkholderia sp. JHI869 TaxID=3112959 RepID=UPI00317F82EA
MTGFSFMKRVPVSGIFTQHRRDASANEALCAFGVPAESLYTDDDCKSLRTTAQGLVAEVDGDERRDVRKARGR